MIDPPETQLHMSSQAETYEEMKDMDVFRDLPIIQINRENTPVLATALGGAVAAFASATVFGPALAKLVKPKRGKNRFKTGRSYYRLTENLVPDYNPYKVRHYRRKPSKSFLTKYFQKLF